MLNKKYDYGGRYFINEGPDYLGVDSWDSSMCKT
jgi:hypothetical protein